MNSIYLLNNGIGPDYYACAQDALLDLCGELEKRLQHKHELLILTCYVNLDLVLDYVKVMREQVKVSKVSLLFDFSEVYRVGPKEVDAKICSISNKLRRKGVDFDYAYLFSSSLVHSKGYAVVQKDCAGDVIGGVSLITSANFTRPGFLGENVEIGQATNSKKLLNEFIETFDFLKDEFGKTSLERETFKREEYLFQYALLESGVFLHKWAGNLKQDLAITYNLTEKAQKQIKQGVPFDLKENSYSLGKKLMRSVLKIDSLPEKLIPKSFIMSYTVETFWGRWCPRDAWNYLKEKIDSDAKTEGKSRFDLFFKEFENITSNKKVDEEKENAKKIQDKLVAGGIIKQVNADHLEKWGNKVAQIRDEGKKRLERYFLGYESSDLPYTVEQKRSVMKLYENLKESMEISKTENKARAKVNAAIVENDLKCLELDSRDYEYINKILDMYDPDEDDEDEFE